jgi:leader peptidase (prepilin peptidase)/N-methyltransferase
MLTGTGFVTLLAYILPRLGIMQQPPRLPRRLAAFSSMAMAVWCAAAWHGGLAEASLSARGRLAALGAVLCLGAAYDLRARVIPNRLLAAVGALLVAFEALVEPQALVSRVGSGALVSAGMVALGLLGGGAIGAGDAKLLGIVGLASGLAPSLLILAGAFVLAAVPGIYHVLFGRGLKHRMAFGPALLASALVLAFVGFGGLFDW